MAMKYIPPRTDLASIQFLKVILRKGKQSPQETRFVSTDQSQLDDLIQRYDEALYQHLEQIAERKKIAEERDRLEERMTTYTRDYLAVLKRYLNREGHPKGLLALFGVSDQGVIPTLGTIEEKLHYTELLLAGAVRMETQGYGIVQCPDADQVRETLEPVLEIMPRYQQVAEQYTTTLIRLETVREEAGELIQKIVGSLRREVQDLEPAKQRQILKTFGLTFKPVKRQRDDEPLEEIYLEQVEEVPRDVASSERKADDPD